MPAYSSSACVDGDARWLAHWHERPLESMRRRGHAAFRRHLDYASNPAGVASALLAEVAVRKRLAPPPPGLSAARSAAKSSDHGEAGIAHKLRKEKKSSWFGR